MILVGDIGGMFQTLMALLDKCPKEEVLALGDLIDRGPRGKEVMDWFMADPKNRTALMGNHEHLMLDYYGEAQLVPEDYYGRRATPDHCWLENGGLATRRSLCPEYMDYRDEKEWVKPYLDWIKELPGVYTEPGLLVSHAPWPGGETPAWIDVIWNRRPPEPIPGIFQVHGHNHRGVQWFPNKADAFAVCIDSTRSEVLTALHWPSKEIFQQPYIDD